MNIENEKNLLPIVKIIAVYIILITAISALPGKIPYHTVREGGLIETLSAAGYFLFCIFILYFNFKGIIQTRFASFFIVLLLGFRELDFHSRFTTMSIFKSRFFISPDVPPMEKSIGTIIVLALIAYIIWYMRKVIPMFRRNLMAAKPWAISVACGVVCAVFSKGVLDGNTKMIAAVLPMLDNPRTFSLILEECVELFIPIFFIRALLQYSMDSVKGRLID